MVATQNYYSLILIVSCIKLKLKIIYFSNYSTKSKHYDDSNKLVVCNMKDETSEVDIEEFVGLNIFDLGSW